MLAALSMCQKGVAGLGYKSGLGNPCGSGYVWDEASSSCSPTQDRIDTTQQTFDYIRSLQLAGSGNQTAPRTNTIAGINQTYLLAGAAALVLILVLKQRRD